MYDYKETASELEEYAKHVRKQSFLANIVARKSRITFNLNISRIL